MSADVDKLKVYLIDDDKSHLRATERLLRASGFDVVTYLSAADFLAELSPGAIGAVVTDYKMPDINGIELQKRLTERENLLPVIFLSGHGNIPTSVQAMRHGAEDFLTKDVLKDELINAVNRAFSRNSGAMKEMAELSGLLDKFATLSPRELEVMQHVVQGKKNKQIACDLNIHERTVKLHRTAITTKLEVTSVAELTMLWMRKQRGEEKYKLGE